MELQINMFLKYMHILLIIVFAYTLCLEAQNNGLRRYRFVIKEASYERLCEKKTILTVNGEFPGPTIKVHKGETIVVDVYNQGKYNITIHWHGVKQPRNPWTDGPEYITQCPIQPGNKFSQKVIFSDEEGTLWWHAHSDWSRATVHGAILIYPKPGTYYPFPQPRAEFPIILGEWWKEDLMQVMEDFVASGGLPVDSDAYTINGQPGDLYPCSNHGNGTFKMRVKHGQKYLLRIINADMNQILFFAVAKHNLTVVAIDAGYTKPLTTNYIAIASGQTIDCILHANQEPSRYHMAARAYTNSTDITFDNTTTTAIVNYENAPYYDPSTPPDLPYIPNYNDTLAILKFTSNLRSLNTKAHPISVPSKINKRIITTISLNVFPCPANQTCEGPNNTRLAASMNNISFVNPNINILEAHFYGIPGVFGKKFPVLPPLAYNYTADVIPFELLIPNKGTQVKVVRYNSNLEIVFQGTNNVGGLDHPMHLHGYSFYVVGSGFGNFDEDKDPLGYNLEDPPHPNTVIVPKNGWAAIRFKANNPGVWFLHCHFERHVTWGMQTVFIVRSGKGPNEHILPPPHDMPPC